MLHVLIDESITYENRKERGMLYLGDIAYEEGRLEALPNIFIYALTHGCVLGQRHTTDTDNDWVAGKVYGLYVPECLDKILPPEFPVDYSLTAENAHARGYKWLYDTGYNRADGFCALNEIIMEMTDNECCLGAPNEGMLYGIYQRIT